MRHPQKVKFENLTIDGHLTAQPMGFLYEWLLIQKQAFSIILCELFYFPSSRSISILAAISSLAKVN